MWTTKPRTILVTAFMPFGEDSVNPTEQVLEALPETIGGMSIAKLLLPVEFGTSIQLARKEYDRVAPSAVIMLGQAGGRSAVTPERYGKNLMDAAIPDNAGNQPRNTPVYAGSPERFRATLPVEKIAESIGNAGIPAEVSEDAGGFVCNYLLYGMLHFNGGEIPTGFIHVPFVREQVEGFPGREGKPFMELADIRRAVETAIETVAKEL